ncbi:MAG: hypothetical protein EZS28_025861 [Streblomastix strix]|uniref:Coatomer subunit zeta n=1 Tax=Streblomastix strix TaxID=222440 RepID=A0A5J4V7Y0_9EUKA|nr:MAG: hypothetical protein EZS28_025861 [Streblomastix strix]
MEGVIFFSTDGRLVYKNYSDNISRYVLKQEAFEDALMSRVIGMKTQEDEIFQMGRLVIEFSRIEDVYFVLVLAESENEVNANAILHLIIDCLKQNLQTTLSRENLLAKYDQVLLVVDSIIDNGYLLDDKVESAVKRSYIDPDLDGGFQEAVQRGEVGEYAEKKISNAMTSLKDRFGKFFK